MSDDYLPLLLANMQQAIVDLRARVDALEDMAAPDDLGDDQPLQYLDGKSI